MTAELDLVRESVSRFARETVAPKLLELNHFPDAALPDGIVPGLAELGLFELGGTDAPALAAALGALASVGAAPAAIVLANAFARSLVQATRPELLAQNGHAARPLAYPLYDEPGLADRAPAVGRSGRALELHGVAELVVNAPLAELLVLPVRDGERLALCALDAATPGVSVGPALLTLGLRGAPTADVTFSHVKLPEDRLLSRDAEAAVREVAQRLRGPAAAISAAIVESSLTHATEYAKERYQGGKQIIEHEEVRRMIAEVAEAHALALEAADRLTRVALPEHRSLALFVQAKERAALATSVGVQLLGGYGYMEDYPEERCMRDAKQAECLFGRVDHERQELTAALAGGGLP